MNLLTALGQLRDVSLQDDTTRTRDRLEFTLLLAQHCNDGEPLPVSSLHQHGGELQPMWSRKPTPKEEAILRDVWEFIDGRV